MNSTEPTAFFVYGTLKQGECRAHYWPHPPLSVEAATVSAELYDLGAYPCIVPGEDCVQGELWKFPAEAIPETIAVLDVVEGYNQTEPNLYLRQVVACSTDSGQHCDAFTYFYANEASARSQRRIRANSAGKCVWPAE